MTKDLRITPTTAAQCRTLCCSDCTYETEGKDFQNCKQRELFYQKGKNYIIC
jgi:hypothetical protein